MAVVFVEAVLSFQHFCFFASEANMMFVEEMIFKFFDIFEVNTTVLAVVMVRALHVMLLQAYPCWEVSITSVAFVVVLGIFFVLF